MPSDVNPKKQLLNERYPADKYVVYLLAELVVLHFFALHYRSQMWRTHKIELRIRNVWRYFRIISCL